MCSTSAAIVHNHRIGPIFPNFNLGKTLSLSTAEAEYKTFTVASKVIDAIVQFYEEIWFPQDTPITIFNDNQAAIAMTKKPFSTACYVRHEIKISLYSNPRWLNQGGWEDTMRPLARILFDRFRVMLMSGQDEAGDSLWGYVAVGEINNILCQVVSYDLN